MRSLPIFRAGRVPPVVSALSRVRLMCSILLRARDLPRR
jgi:hypothetical protein